MMCVVASFSGHALCDCLSNVCRYALSLSIDRVTVVVLAIICTVDKNVAYSHMLLAMLLSTLAKS